MDTSAFTGFQITDAYNDSTVDFSVYLFADSGFAKATVSHGAGAGYTLNIPIGSFSTLGSFDPAHVKTIDLILDPTVLGGDVQIGSFSGVPEPSEYGVMAGLGLVGFGAYRRFRKA